MGIHMVARAIRASVRRMLKAPPAFRAGAIAGNGQTATSNTLTITLPATIVTGDVGYIFVINGGSTLTLATPSGWTPERGPDTNSTNAATWVYSRDLTTALAGTTVTLTFTGTANRCDAVMLGFSGGTRTGQIISTATVETTAVTTTALPSMSLIPANSMIIGAFNRRRSGAAGTVTPPAGYTTPASNGRSATNYASGVNVWTDTAYKVLAAGGTQASENGTSGVSAVGNNYLIALPPA